MTELQIYLIGIGIVIIVGVVAYNKWQEYQAHKKVQRAFADAPEDVLMQSASDEAGFRKEPGFFRNTVEGVSLENSVGDAPISITGLNHAFEDEDAGQSAVENREALTDTDEAGQVSSEGMHREPYIDLDDTQEKTALMPESLPQTDEAGFAAEKPAVSSMISAPVVDDLIDYSIPLDLEEPIRGEKLLPLMQSLRYTRNNKPIHFVGLVRDAETGNQYWQSIVHGGIYHQLKIGVQLANRTGYLNEIEYSELITRLRQVADSIGAEPEIPDMTEVIRIARSLYQFVVDHDARLGINVRTGGAPWAVKTLVAVLERQNFDLRPDGFFVMHDEDGSVLFTLTINAPPAADTAGLLTLLLDVPCVAQEKNGFAGMVQCAKSLCQRLNGILVDDDDKMLSDPMLEDIAGQVGVFYEEMKVALIPAGSVRAMRLFN